MHSIWLVLVLSVLSSSVRGGTVGDLTYSITDGQVVITDCDTSAEGELTIPAEIEGLPVTSIGDAAFFRCSSLTSITIPEGVTSIGNEAFHNCSSLTSITIPEGVTSIGNGAFWGCSSLTSITIPDSVTSIGRGAFIRCGLNSITIPDGVTSIGGYAFWDCSRLTSITIPDSVTSIGEQAFRNCSSLASIAIPGTVNSVGNAAFIGCGNLTTLLIPLKFHSESEATRLGLDSSLYPEGFLPPDPRAVAIAILSNGFVVDAHINFPGASYVEVPKVTIIGGGGQGAEAVAYLSDQFSIESIKITNAGSGYTSPPKIIIDQPTTMTIPHRFSLLPESQQGFKGEEILVPFRVEDYLYITGFQFSLAWDPEIMKLVTEGDTGNQVKLGQVAVLGEWPNFKPMLTSSNFGIQEPGSLTFLWDEALNPELGQTLVDDTVLFSLAFQLVGAGGSSTTLSVVETPTAIRALHKSGIEIPLYTEEALIEVSDAISLTGAITLFGEGLKPIPWVKILTRQGAETVTTFADEGGQYLVSIEPVFDYQLTASLASREFPSAGVDVSDIIMLRKHILNLERLPNNMSMLAADVNRDGFIDVGDIIGMRKVILGIDAFYSIQSDGTPEDIFRFVNAEFTDGAVENFFSDLAEASVISLDGPSANTSGVDFAGVKLGDTNGDWEPPTTGSTTLEATPAGDRLGQPIANAYLDFGSVKVTQDGHMNLPLYLTANEPLMGVQFELNWDRTLLALDSISSSALPGFSPNFHTSVHEGSAKVAWDDAMLSGIQADGSEPLLMLHFNRLSEGATGLELKAPVLAGNHGSLGWVQPVSAYLKPDNTVKTALSGAIKYIEVEGGQLELVVDTQVGQSYQLQTVAKLNSDEWKDVMRIQGSDTWQKVVLPAEAQKAYLRLVSLNSEAIR